MESQPNVASTSTAEGQWQQFRPIISSLYVEQQKTLIEVISHMKESYGFEASIHQYKRKFAKWDLQKNSRMDNAGGTVTRQDTKLLFSEAPTDDESVENEQDRATPMAQVKQHGECESEGSPASMFENNDGNMSEHQRSRSSSIKSSGNASHSTSSAQSSSNMSMRDTHPSDPSSNSSTPLPAARTTHKRKRTHEAPEATEYSDDSDGSGFRIPNKRLKHQNCSAEDNTKRFACPYYKYDPIKYSERNSENRVFRKCTHVLLTDLARLKQHLKRTHVRPRNYCARCFAVFESSDEVDAHSRTANCNIVETKFDGLMTFEQESVVMKKKPVTTSNEQHWKEIYSVLFPGKPLPKSPYVDSSLHDTAFFNIFRDKMATRLEEALRAQLPHLKLDTQALVSEVVQQSLQAFSPLTGRKTSSDIPLIAPSSYDMTTDQGIGAPASVSSTNDVDTTWWSVITPSTDSSSESLWQTKGELAHLTLWDLHDDPNGFDNWINEDNSAWLDAIQFAPDSTGDG